MLRAAAVLVLAGALSAAAPGARVAAQDSTFAVLQDTAFVVDRVVAVVGNQPILGSQIEEQLFTMLSARDAPPLATAADTAKAPTTSPTSKPLPPSSSSTYRGRVGSSEPSPRK